MKHMRPWQLFCWVKLVEVVAQTRPRALRRLLWNPEKKIRHAIRWYYKMGRRVWFHEILHFIFKDRFLKTQITLQEFSGPPLDADEYAMATPHKSKATACKSKLLFATTTLETDRIVRPPASGASPAPPLS